MQTGAYDDSETGSDSDSLPDDDPIDVNDDQISKIETKEDLQSGPEFPAIADAQDDCSSEDEERENRFIDPASTWRFYTESERGLAASLDQLRANDLSVHLYNAHAIRSRARDAEAVRTDMTVSKKRRLSDVDQHSRATWQPDSTWTAWPMRPEDVPRKQERFGVPLSPNLDSTTYRKAIPWERGADLEAEVQAVMLGKAIDHARETKDQPILHFASSSMLLNDEQSNDAVQPLARKVRSQLDDLFMRLHARRVSASRTHSRSRTRVSVSRSGSRSKLRQPSDNDDDIVFEQDDVTDEDATIAAPPRHKRKTLKLWTWQDVLHRAALAGFEPDAVDRASARCAKLFQEDSAPKRVYSCPQVNCARHGFPYEQAWRWREHLKRKHKWATDEVQEAEESLLPIAYEDPPERDGISVSNQPIGTIDGL